MLTVSLFLTVALSGVAAIAAAPVPSRTIAPLNVPDSSIRLKPFIALLPLA